ncbi:LOW QUALITY PROTEIN: coiled-coil domain-containing protein 185-like [Sarcoramphus papa]
MGKATRGLNHNLLRGKVAQAFEKRCLKEIEGKKKRQELIQYKKTRHRHLKVNHQVKVDELSKRLAVEQKLQRSQEIPDQLMEERIRESKQKALMEDEQSFMAKFRAKEKVEEKRRHKNMLLNIPERKIEQAPEMPAKTIQQKVKHIKEINCLKERNHHSQRHLDDDEKCQLQEIEAAISRRDQRSNLVLRSKESVGEKVGKNTQSILWPETKRERTDQQLNK